MSGPTLDALVADLALPEPTYVTRPALPPLADYQELLKEVWASRWLTNRGALHERFSVQLAAHLGVPHLSVVSNGTLALLLALRALDLTEGEVITTPFTFPATPHAITFARLTPVFADVDPVTLCLDPAAVRERISERTVGVLAVHVYGQPCDVAGLRALADEHDLRLVYDAAHAFGARLDGRPLAAYGDAATLSFHATKLFSTAEGGAVVCRTPELRERLDFLRNFGIADEETVESAGLNAKLSELHSALGLLRLRDVDDEIARRGALVARYRERLARIPGCRLMPAPGDGWEPNHAYMPVRIDAAAFGSDRDALTERLRRFNVFARKYFYPLCTRAVPYRDLPSAQPGENPVAEAIAEEVLCLPLYGDLPLATVERICDVLGALQAHAGAGA